MNAQRGASELSVRSRRLTDVTRRISTSVVVVVDLWVGLAWLLLPAHYWAASYYAPARQVMSWLPRGQELRGWGVLLIVLALGWFLRRTHHGEITRLCLAGLVALWSFWLILVLIGWLTSHTGGLAPPLTFLAVRAHWPGSVLPRKVATWRRSHSSR
jgi:hypothetical protein